MVALVVTAACLRVAFNNVRRYGNGDEYHYALQASAIFSRGWSCLPALVNWHLASEPDFPAPYRFGNLAFARVACAVRQVCDERSLAWVSTISGIVVVAVVALLARKLFTRRAAFVATALAITSPLHLELGRRAYADELHTALVLLSLWGLAYVAAPPAERTSVSHRRIWVLVSLVSLTLAWSVKESVAFMLPSLAFWLFSLRSPRAFKFTDAALLLAPAVLALLGFVALNHGFAKVGELFDATRASLMHPYSVALQAGPPHRSLVELFTLSPWVYGVLPVAAFLAFGVTHTSRASDANPERSRAHALATALLLLLGAFAFLPKNLRFVAFVDPLARILVAWFVCEILPINGRGGRLWCASILLANAAFELAIFHRTFVTSSVTDPTASAIFGALQMTPAEVRAWHPPAVVYLATVLSCVFAWAAARKVGFGRKSLLAAGFITVLAVAAPQMLRPKRGLSSAEHSHAALRTAPYIQLPQSTPEKP